MQPLGLVYLENSNVLMAWCLLRKDFRTFRLDRIHALTITDTSFRPRRVPLLRDYKAKIQEEMDQYQSA